MYRLQRLSSGEPKVCVWISDLTIAFEAISNPPRGAVAFKAAGCVGAGGVSVTVVGSNLTLIDI